MFCLSRKIFVSMMFFVVALCSLSSVSAATFYVDESWSSDDIQSLLDDDALDITELYFSKLGSGIYNSISLDIYRGVNIVCDIGVSIVGYDGNSPLGYAFSIFEDNVNITGFTLTDYFVAVVATGVNNLNVSDNVVSNCDSLIEANDIKGLTIINNTFNGNGEGVAIDLASINNSNISNNTINNGIGGVSLSESDNATIGSNSISDIDGDGISVDTASNVNIEDNKIANSQSNGISVSNVENGNISKNNVSNSGEVLFQLILLRMLILIKMILMEQIMQVFL